MKPSSLLIAAFVPFVATAGAAPESSPAQEIDHQQLQDDLQVTTLLGADVQSGEGQQVGAIEDVIFGKDGSISSVIIQQEGDLEGTMQSAGQTAEDTMTEVQETAEGAWEDVTTEDAASGDSRDAASSQDAAAEGEASSGGGMGLDPDRATTMEMGDAFVKVDWNSISVEKNADAVRLNQSAEQLQTVQYDQSEPLPAGGEVRASKLVGMEVNLTDEESFGEVEDVMIDMQSGKASAIIVDSMEFFDKERYAFPVDLENVNLEEEELTLQYTQQQIEGMQEFQMGEEETADPAVEEQM